MWNLFIAAHENAYGGTLYSKCLYWFRTFIIQSNVFLFCGQFRRFVFA